MKNLSRTAIPRIRLLDPDVSARIAAGEVVERPASVVRELLDNAIDSGATRIRIETGDGGRKLVRVRDNGCGMAAADLPLAVEKHATSKIRELADLSRVVSLGFRGEALHALATVARVRIVTSDGSTSAARELLVEGGGGVELRDAAGDAGTLVEVTRLFHSIPARREFLKSALAEGRAVRQEVLEKMLAWPDRAFEYLADGKKVYASPAGTLRERIADLYGPDLAGVLLPVAAEENGMALSGFVAPAERHSASRHDQVFILNGRPVASASLSHALRSAYGNLLPPGRQPIAFLNLSVNPGEVNVNIHPAKREVRFLREQEVYTLIRRAAAAVLAGGGYARPAGGFFRAARDNAGHPPVSGPLPDAAPSFEFREPPRGVPADPVSSGAEAGGMLSGRFAGMRIRTCLFRNYWVLEGEGKLLMVDQHAAHERVLYERYRRELDGNGVARQGLLVPHNLELAPGEAALAGQHAAALAEAGFSLVSFGPDSWALEAVPAWLQDEGEAAFRELLALYAGNLSKKEKRERMLSTLACRSAVKQGDRIPETMLVQILNELDGLERPFSCPHGRPAILEIPEKEVAKWFKRT